MSKCETKALVKEINSKAKAAKIKQKSAIFDGEQVFFDAQDAINGFTTTRAFRMSYVAWLDRHLGLTKGDKKLALSAFDVGLALGQIKPKDKSWRNDIK